MDKMPSVTRLLSLAKVFEAFADDDDDETQAQAKRDAAELLRDHASDEKTASRMVTLIELIATAAASIGNNPDKD